MPHFDEKSGRLYAYPVGVEAASAARSHLYTDTEHECIYCGLQEPTRYVSDDQCYSCLITGCTDPITGAKWHGVNGERERLAGTDLIVEAKGCRGGSHLVIHHRDNRRCVTCEEAKANKSPSPRQKAVAAGEKWYMPEKPCPHCGQTALKRVDNGQCRGCRPASSRARVDELPPGTVMDRDTAMSLGFKVYRTGKPCKNGHTGVRYVSTRQCVDCRKETPPWGQ